MRILQFEFSYIVFISWSLVMIGSQECTWKAEGAHADIGGKKSVSYCIFVWLSVDIHQELLKCCFIKAFITCSC